MQLISVKRTDQAGGANTGADQGNRDTDQAAGDQSRGRVLRDAGSFQVVLNVSRDKLQNGPKFPERNWPNMTSQWGEQVYNHYGVRPFWKGGMGGREGMQERGGTGGQQGQQGQQDHEGHGHDESENR
jgi:hypothetical protein